MSPIRNRDYHSCNWVQVATGDGLRLDGLLHDETWAAASMEAIRSETIVLLMHGAGGNFYGPSLLNRVGTHFMRLGWPVLRANNRGHDGWHVAFRGGKTVPMGAAFERLEESAWDVAAWLGWLKRQGYQRVVLVGHSLGAFKSLFALGNRTGSTEKHPAATPTALNSKRPEASVMAAVAISPPCLSQQLFENSRQAEVFRETVEQCRLKVASGQMNDVFQAAYPFPMLISPGCYLNKYVSGERFNFTTWLDQLHQPILWMFGEGELESHEALARGVQELELRMPTHHCLIKIPEADHFFTGWSREVCVAVEKWLETYK